MKKLQVFGISLFIFLFFLVSLVSAIRINEVELNPEGDDAGNEWIELYSASEMSLIGWKIMNNDNDTINLNETFTGYFVIILETRWLDNTDEKIYLYANESLIDSTDIFNDNHNDNRTWQYCDGWIFKSSSTKDGENFCDNGNGDNGTGIYIELEYDEEEDDRQDIDVKVKVYNLKNEFYDIKIYITDKNDNIITETYHEDVWKSSDYYVRDKFRGPGNKTEKLKLRINDDEFSGDAGINARIRLSGASNILDEFKDNIEILEKQEGVGETGGGEVAEGDEGEENTETSKLTGNVIKLNTPKNIKSEDNKKNKEYKSKKQYIKEYAIYGFALFCVVFLIVLLRKNKGF